MNNSVIFTNTSYLGNVGDFWCSPLHYYSFPFKIEHIHYMDIVRDIKCGNIKRYTNRKIIIGGGGMLTENGSPLSKTLEFLIENNKVILWGIGSNSLGEYSWKILNHTNIILKGIRDWTVEIDESEYLPCVSCKHKLFETFNNRIPKNDFGLLEHSFYRINLPNNNSITNAENINKFLLFIVENERLVSSTYHGIYWAQLLKRKIAYYSNSYIINSKFKNLKYPVPIVNSKNLKNWNYDANIYDSYLVDNIKLNGIFYNKVIHIFSS